MNNMEYVYDKFIQLNGIKLWTRKQQIQII